MAQTVGSTVIDAPIADVWAIIRDFTSTPKWFAPALSCVIDGGGPSDQVGNVKIVGLPGGGSVREKLTGLSDRDHVLTYQIQAETDAGTARGAWGAQARVEMRPITDSGATYVEWSHEFDVVEGALGDVVAFYEALYPKFFDGLRAHATAKPPATRAAA